MGESIWRCHDQLISEDFNDCSLAKFNTEHKQSKINSCVVFKQSQCFGLNNVSVALLYLNCLSLQRTQKWRQKAIPPICSFTPLYPISLFCFGLKAFEFKVSVNFCSSCLLFNHNSRRKLAKVALRVCFLAASDWKKLLLPQQKELLY